MAICPNIVKWIVPILGVVSTLFGAFSGVASIHTEHRSHNFALCYFHNRKRCKRCCIHLHYPCNPLAVVFGFLSIGFVVMFSLIGFPFLFYRRVLCSCKTFVAMFPILLATLGVMGLILPMLYCDKTEVYVHQNPSTSSTSCPNVGLTCLLGSIYPLFSSIVWSFAIKFFEEDDSSHNKFSSKVVPTLNVA